jgi:hypothetical protein
MYSVASLTHSYPRRFQAGTKPKRLGFNFNNVVLVCVLH